MYKSRSRVIEEPYREVLLQRLLPNISVIKPETHKRRRWVGSGSQSNVGLRKDSYWSRNKMSCLYPVKSRRC